MYGDSANLYPSGSVTLFDAALRYDLAHLNPSLGHGERELSMVGAVVRDILAFFCLRCAVVTHMFTTQPFRNTVTEI